MGLHLGLIWFFATVIVTGAIWVSLRLLELWWQRPVENISKRVWLNSIEWLPTPHYDTALYRHGETLAPYRDRDIPHFNKNDFINIIFWVLVSLAKLARNYYIFGYLIDAAFTVGPLDSINFSKFYLPLALWVITIGGTLLPSYIQTKANKQANASNLPNKRAMSLSSIAILAAVILLLQSSIACWKFPRSK